MQHYRRFLNIARITLGVSTVALVTAGCAGAAGDDGAATSSDEVRVSTSFIAKGTGYYPDKSPMEGGFQDRNGKKLQTLQQFLAGKASYVAVAMDSNAFSYGTRLRIRELDEKHKHALDKIAKKEIVFRVVDTGGEFVGKGRLRVDICTENEKASLDPTVNGTLNIDVVGGAGDGFH